MSYIIKSFTQPKKYEIKSDFNFSEGDFVEVKTTTTDSPVFEFKEKIIIINNESITFNFNSLVQLIGDYTIINEEKISEDDDMLFINEEGPDEFVLESYMSKDLTDNNDDNIKKILIVAKFGNLDTKFYSRPITLIKSKDESEWDIFTYSFNLNKEQLSVFELSISDDEPYYDYIKFNIYNKKGDTISYQIKYRIIDRSEISSYEIITDDYNEVIKEKNKVKFRLLSANLDNNGKISFMFDNIASKKSQIVLAEIKKS